VDYGGDISKQGNLETLRTRILRAITGAIARKVFNDDEIRWATMSHGNYLIDDDEVDTIAVSDSVKGESVSWMLFGHLRNKAERFAIQALKVPLRVVGGRRRMGR